MSGPRGGLEPGLRAPLAAFAIALALSTVALVTFVPAVAAQGEGHGARPIDGLLAATEGIAFFTDCDDGGITTECGGAPAHWFSDKIPVQLCTHQFARPAYLTAEQFRTFVEDAAEMWNTLEAAVGYQYVGDCSAGFRWEDDNDVNEVGFDDSRNVVTGTAAAIARGSWFGIPFFGIPSDRRFVEFDVVIDIGSAVPDACILSVIAHEFGHVLGFGHSSVTADLMFNSFDPDDLSTCPTVATADERDALQQLYGANSGPTLQVTANQLAVPGTSVDLIADATDPENDPISYAWEQTGGPPVTFVAIGPQLTFTAPDDGSVALEFTVSARDTYRHLDTATIDVTFDESTGLPVLQPSFARFQAGTGSLTGGAALGWTARDDASSYRFCTNTPFTGGAESCSAQASPTAATDWDTIVGTIGEPDVRRVFTTGARETSMAACNAAGCTTPGVGPLIGGLRWPSWEIDFDYLAMAFDVPGTNIKWTIGGVTNIEDPARRFEMYVGTPQDPLQERIWSCGNVAVNGVCFGLLSPSDDGHLSQLTIVSSRDGTPTTEHRIRIR